MGKKKSRASQTSKGERRNVVNGLGDTRTPLQKLSAKQAAWKKGKNVVLSIPNPNTNETNKPFIRVPATQVWGKYQPYMMKKTD
tara:strand:- start:4932 stop:5183 length:252 start_codon:yes stop_codon:yes gene_type:complete